jgi:hypothetical protein
MQSPVLPATESKLVPATAPSISELAASHGSRSAGSTRRSLVRPTVWMTLVAVALVLACSACAMPSAPTSVRPSVLKLDQVAMRSTTPTLALDWTIGSVGKTGCMVCHGNRNLIDLAPGQLPMFLVDASTLQRSAHASNLCTDCHVDFGSNGTHPGANPPPDWRTTTANSCQRCHRTEFEDWAGGLHSAAGDGGNGAVGGPTSSAPGKPKPVCGDCHDAHSVPARSDSAGRAAIQRSALSICGRCHVRLSANYADYYHGSAYRSGAPDAPTCWQCHNAHRVLPSDNGQSPTHQDNLTTTCSKCHQDVGRGYTQYAQLVHSQETMYQNNPIVSAMGTATMAFDSMLDEVLWKLRASRP